jgi:uncharacterized protein (TIGR00369 family)
MMTESLLDQLQASLDEPGFCRVLGIKVEAWDAEAKTLVLTMLPRPELEGGAGPGHMHGGAIGAFVDTAATFALFAAGVKSCSTANYRTDLLKPVVNSSLTARARVRRIGRTLAIVDVDVENAAKGLSAVGRVTMAILD